MCTTPRLISRFKRKHTINCTALVGTNLKSSVSGLKWIKSMRSIVY